MTWPQIVMIVLYTLSLAEGFSKHGTPRTGNHNAFVSVLAVAIGVAILYFGGFWK